MMTSHEFAEYKALELLDNWSGMEPEPLAPKPMSEQDIQAVLEKWQRA